MPRATYPERSLLAAMLGENAPVDVRRAARRLRSEGAPAVAVDHDIVRLAQELASSDVSRSPAVPDALPPLFWLEAPQDGKSDAEAIRGWVVEKKLRGLVARGFSLAFAQEAVPEPAGVVTVTFIESGQEEDEELHGLRGLVTAVSLPEVLSQMGESPPVILIPANASDRDTNILRGFTLSVAISPGSA